jgi:peptidoglycan hydrolase CwlO-like protein
MGLYATLKLAVSNIKMKKYSRHMASFTRHLKTPAVLAIAGCLMLGAIPMAYAQTTQQQIDNLNEQNSQSESSLNALQLQATSYQNAISTLQTQINAIQGAINANEAQEASLQQQIGVDQSQIAQQKRLLGQDIEAMYVGGQMTTVEMLATSNSLSDFVNEETYKGSVQDKLQSLLTQIAKLENSLESQQTQLQQSLTTQEGQQTQLDSAESQQNNLLGMNQTQQATYNQQIQSNQAQIASLEAEQAAINGQYAGSVTVAPSSGGGACNIGQGFADYPWCNAPFTFDTSPTDPNGFPERQCTSFAYWYFTSVEGRPLNSNLGNAGQWWYTANQPVDQTPEVGAIGVEPSNAPPHYSPYGHVMIVLALSGTTYEGALPYTSQADGIQVPQGDVLVMSMNENEEGDFMIQTWPADTLDYIH